MTISEKERTTLIEYRLEKARKGLSEIDFLLKNNMLNLAVNRIYYAAFYALSALALKHRFPTSRHRELIGWFNQNFIKKETVAKKHGQFIHKAYDKRSKGDYADFVEFSAGEVVKMRAELDEFIAMMSDLIAGS